MVSADKVTKQLVKDTKLADAKVSLALWDQTTTCAMDCW